MPALPLRRRPQLSEEVADHVRTRIMSGELRPGDFIRLDETAADLGVSVTPVREALLTLRGEGLVDLVPRRGYTVCPMSRQDVEDIFWLQSTLAQQLLERAVPRFSSEDIDRLHRLVDSFDSASAAGDTDAVVSAQYAIFRMINRMGESDKLARFLANATRYMPHRLYAADPEWRRAALEWNLQLAAAIRAGDTAAAIAASQVQFTDGSRRLLSHLEQAGFWEENPLALV